jgi:AraC-like DNA-binding protein
MYTTITILRNIIYGAASKGIQLDRLCSAAGIDMADLNEMDRKVEGIRPVVNLWEEVIRGTGDDFFGLHLGLRNNSAQLGLVGYLMQHCPTIRDAFISLRNHQEKFSGWISYSLKQDRDNISIYYKIDPLWQNISPDTARHAIDMSMSGTLALIKTLTGVLITPLQVDMAAEKTIIPCEYERIYKTEILFGMPDNRMILKKKILELPILSYDQSLYILFNRLLEEQKKSTKQASSFKDQVKRILAHEFNGQVPPLPIMASQLHLSERSFQRKLQLEGYTYRSLSVELKKEIAVNLLENSNAKINTISELLGYTEPSAFRKAFKSWTDATPVQVKNERLMRATG